MNIKPLGTLFKGWFGSYRLETDRDEVIALAANNVYGTTVYAIESVYALQSQIMGLKIRNTELEAEVSNLKRELELFKQFKQSHDLCPMRSEK